LRHRGSGGVNGGISKMALIRFNLDLAIPEAIYNSIPLATKTAFRDRVRALKAQAVKINAGQSNEEATL